MNILCVYCQSKLKDPIECDNCQINICKEHINNNNECPVCRIRPVKYHVNMGLEKLLSQYEIINNNLKIMMDNDIIECQLCKYEGKSTEFCYHLCETHKENLIEIFGKKKHDIYQDYSHNKHKDDSIKEKNEINQQINNYNNNDNDNQRFNQPNQKKKIDNKDNSPFNQISRKYSGQINTVRNNNVNYSIINISDLNPPSKSVNQNLEMYYCNKKNELIKCDCCPDHICCKGNCMCVNCMKQNLMVRGLRNKELINKAEKIAKCVSGEYHCGEKFRDVIIDEIGEEKKTSRICQNHFFCKECKILNKYKDEYLKYLY